MMRAMRIWVAVGAAAALTTSCSTTSAKSGAYAPVSMDAPSLVQSLEAMRGEAYRGKTSKAAELDAVIAAMPAWLRVTHGPVSLDTSSGATRIPDVKISLAFYPAAGIGVSDLRLWDFDSEFARARLAGQRLSETAQLASRVEADAVAVFGLDQLIEDATKLAGSAARSAAPEGTKSDLDQAFDFKLGAYDMSIGRIVVKDLVLRPYALERKSLAANSPLAPAFPMLQQASAVVRSIAYDTLAEYDGRIQFSYEQLGRRNSASMGFDLAGARGVRGGDTDVSVLSGLRYDLDMRDPTLDLPMKVAGTVGQYSMEGLRLDRVLDHLARGVMPARSERDLLSLGVMTSENEAYSINGAPVYSAKRSSVDLTRWRWIVPTRLAVSIEDASYDIPSMIGMFTSIDPKLFGDPKDKARMDGVLQALARHGLDKPLMDAKWDLSWNDQTGDGEFDMSFGIDQFMQLDLSLEGGLPDFDSVSALVPEDFNGVRTDEISRLFAARSTYRGASIDLIDQGGLDKAFGLTVDLAKLAPPDDQTFAMFRNSTPEGLRQMTSSLLLIASSAVAKEFPPAQTLLATAASWIVQGGALHFRSSPDTPLGAADLSGPASKDPVALFDKLKITLRHEKPPTQN